MAAKSYVALDVTRYDSDEGAWSLYEVLERALQARGYREIAGYGWQAGSTDETAWVYALLKTADMLDSEIRRLEHDMRRAGAPLRKWCVLREGGAAAAAAAEPSVQPEACSEGGDDYWLEDRVLMDIYAYNEAHAIYLFALDFVQPLVPNHPSDEPFPADYMVDVIDLLDEVMHDEDGHVQITAAMRRFVDMDLGNYRLVPSYMLVLNEEERHHAGVRRC